MKDKITECVFPDCGCPEARLCMGGEPNDACLSLNRPPFSQKAYEHEIIIKNKRIAADEA